MNEAKNVLPYSFSVHLANTTGLQRKDVQGLLKEVTRILAMLENVNVVRAVNSFCLY